MYADIWSLGCTIYEMLNGHPPFEGKNQYQILDLITKYDEKHFVFPPGMSFLSVSFVRCCLRKKPYDWLNIKELK